MPTLKAGCYLIDIKNRKVALVYREKQNDFTFPKGHLEEGETLEECAKRETAEETKRECKIVSVIPPTIERYTTLNGENCECYLYVAIDIGASDNTSLDTHPTIWVNFDEVEERLTYPGLKKQWNLVKDSIIKMF